MELSQGLSLSLLILSALGAVVSMDNVQVFEGESVTLSVNLNMSEYQMITWKFDTYTLVAIKTVNNTPTCFPEYEGRCTLFANATLLLDNLTPAEEGNYTLTVMDVETGASLSGSIFLSVQGNIVNTTQDSGTQQYTTPDQLTTASDNNQEYTPGNIVNTTQDSGTQQYTTPDQLTTASDNNQEYTPDYDPTPDYVPITEYDPATTVSEYNPVPEYNSGPDYYPESQYIP
ncbi:pregnancy-specific glycoprotein 22-like isoform X12 [Xenopus tropicalis]|uniref:Pregnancy-specific glycoprotein 22-like isoform X12 n=1 Tax=Xenopus tropicalis TaxID=8364 RepID=A0A8J1K1K5_XENTR|nr:pregnancy-specific glycoprotein 22-like isoform X12 [Xenopus tropicalis]